MTWGGYSAEWLAAEAKTVADFNPERLCPKCGFQSISDRLISTGGTPIRRREYIERTCLRCKHTWYERPLDWVEPTPDEQEKA